MPFHHTIIRTDRDGGVPADFPFRVSSIHFPLGAADPFFQTAQADGGDIRAFSSAGVPLAVEKVQWNKAAGVVELIVRTPVALLYGDFIVLRTGGDAAVFPGDDDPLGMKAVYAGTGAVIATHDWIKNSVTGGAFILDALGSSPVASAGPNGLIAMNFNRNVPPQNTLDAADIVMESPSAISLYMLVNPKSKGVIDNFGRFCQGGGTSFELYFDGATGNILFEQEYSLADPALQGEWTAPFATFGVWSGIALTHTGEGTPSPLPHWWINRVPQVVTEKKPPPANPSLNETVTMSFFNHNPALHNKPLDCEGSEGFIYNVVKSDDFMLALSEQFEAPATFAAAVDGGAAFPAFVPSKAASTYFAAMSVQLTAAQQQQLDDLLIRPSWRAGLWQKLDYLYDYSSYASGADLLINLADPANFTITRASFPAHVAGQGTSFDGVDDIDVTGFLFPAGANASLNQLTMMFYSRTAGQTSNGSMGAKRTTGSATMDTINPRTTADLFIARANNNVTFSAPNQSGVGLFGILRTAADAETIFIGKTAVATDAAAPAGLPTFPIGIGGIKGNGASSPTDSFAARELSIAALGAFSSEAEYTQFAGYVLDLLAARGVIPRGAVGAKSASLSAAAAGALRHVGAGLANASRSLAALLAATTILSSASVLSPSVDATAAGALAGGGTGLRPSTADGKQITQRGLESPMWWSGFSLALKNKRMLIPLRAAAAGAQEPFVTSLLVGGVQNGKGTHQRIVDGDLDPSTGWHFLPEGASTPIMHPRWHQGGGHPELQQGDWSITIDVRASDNSPAFGFTGWTENGTQNALTGGVTRLVNNSAPFDFNRRRFIRTLTVADTAQSVYTITGPVGGCWIRYWYSGLVADELTWETDDWRDDWITDAAEEKVLRDMDVQWMNDAKIAKADDVIDDGYYFFSGNAGSWGSPLAANDDLRKAGANLKKLLKAAKRAGATFHHCVPGTFGAFLANDPTNGFWSSNYRQSAGSAGFTAARDYLHSIFPSIIAAAKAEYRLRFQRIIQAAIDAGWLDDDLLEFELGNEGWNRSFVQLNRWLEYLEWHLKLRGSITHGVGNSTRGGGGAGYLCNLMATEAAQVIAEMKPGQRWQVTVGLQTNTAPSEFTASAIEGWNIFSAEFPAASRPISEFGMAPTDYLSDAMKWSGPKSAGVGNNMFDAATETEFNNFYIALYLSGGETAIFNKARDWMLSAGSVGTVSVGGSSATRILAQHLAHKATLEAAGAQLRRPYEGSSHDQIDNTQTLPDAFDAATGQTDGMVALMLAWNRSEQAREVFATFFAWKAANGLDGVTNYYKYTSIKNWNGGGPWFEKHMSQLGVTPTTGIAKAYYDVSRAGAGGPVLSNEGAAALGAMLAAGAANQRFIGNVVSICTAGGASASGGAAHRGAAASQSARSRANAAAVQKFFAASAPKGAAADASAQAGLVWAGPAASLLASLEAFAAGDLREAAAGAADLSTQIALAASSSAIAGPIAAPLRAGLAIGGGGSRFAGASSAVSARVQSAVAGLSRFSGSGAGGLKGETATASGSSSVGGFVDALIRAAVAAGDGHFFIAGAGDADVRRAIAAAIAAQKFLASSAGGLKGARAASGGAQRDAGAGASVAPGPDGSADGVLQFSGGGGAPGAAPLFASSGLVGLTGAAAGIAALLEAAASGTAILTFVSGAKSFTVTARGRTLSVSGRSQVLDSGNKKRLH